MDLPVPARLVPALAGLIDRHRNASPKMSVEQRTWWSYIRGNKKQKQNKICNHNPHTQNKTFSSDTHLKLPFCRRDVWVDCSAFFPRPGFLLGVGGRFYAEAFARAVLLLFLQFLLFGFLEVVGRK